MWSRAAMASGCRCSTGMPSTTGKMQQWQPRMPSWISSPVERWNIEVTSSSRPPQNGQRRMSRVSMCIGRFRPANESAADRSSTGLRSPRGGSTRCRASAGRRPARARSNGCPMPICVSWHRMAASFRGTHVCDVDDDRRRLGGDAEGLRHEAPEALRRRRPAARRAAATICGIDAARHRHVVERRRRRRRASRTAVVVRS